MSSHPGIAPQSQLGARITLCRLALCCWARRACALPAPVLAQCAGLLLGNRAEPAVHHSSRLLCWLDVSSFFLSEALKLGMHRRGSQHRGQASGQMHCRVEMHSRVPSDPVHGTPHRHVHVHLRRLLGAVVLLLNTYACRRCMRLLPCGLYHPRISEHVAVLVTCGTRYGTTYDFV
jgi:hypothetical protein